MDTRNLIFDTEKNSTQMRRVWLRCFCSSARWNWAQVTRCVAEANRPLQQPPVRHSDVVFVSVCSSQRLINHQKTNLSANSFEKKRRPRANARQHLPQSARKRMSQLDIDGFTAGLLLCTSMVYRFLLVNVSTSFKPYLVWRTATNVSVLILRFSLCSILHCWFNFRLANVKVNHCRNRRR